MSLVSKNHLFIMLMYGSIESKQSIMDDGRVNKKQKSNQKLLKEVLHSPQLIKNISVDNCGVIFVNVVEWDNYWQVTENHPCKQGLDRFHQAWDSWIKNKFHKNYIKKLVYSYFALLETAMHQDERRTIDQSFLQKIVSFESFCVVDSASSVAATINQRNPVYLLSKVFNPDLFDNPKYLPLVCVPQSDNQPATFGHYRRVAIKNSDGAQLFLYLSCCDETRYNRSYKVVHNIQQALMPKTDPWASYRSQALFQTVFKDIVQNDPKPAINILDLGCGTADVTLRTCLLGHIESHKSFNLTLVDVIPVRRHLVARYLFKHNRLLTSLRYKRDNLFSWLINFHKENKVFDVTLMLRVLDLFSRICIEKIPPQTLALPEPKYVGTSNAIYYDSSITQHGLKKRNYMGGQLYCQPALTDYYRAVLCLLTNTRYLSTDLYLPVRRFNEKALFLPDGTSLIRRIAALSNQLIIEDIDLTSQVLNKHMLEQGLTGFDAVEMRNKQECHASHITKITFHDNRSVGNAQ